MGLIASLVMGLLVGMAAGFLMKSNYPWYIDVALGIVGSIVGGWITSLLLGQNLVSGFNLTSFVVSLIGAVIVVAIYRAVTRRCDSRRGAQLHRVERRAIIARNVAPLAARLHITHPDGQRDWPCEAQATTRPRRASAQATPGRC